MPPVTIEQALQLALGHHQAGQIVEAESIYRQILAVQPAHPDALHLLGIAAAAQGRLEEAVDGISRALSFAPGHAIYHANLGVTFRRLGHYDEAVTHLREATRLDPASATHHMNLGDALMARGDVDESMASSRRACDLEPNLAAAHNNLGNAFVARRLWTEATACFERALALDPNYAEAHNNLGNILIEKHQGRAAIGHFERALALNPQLSEAYGNLGVAWFEEGRPDMAVAFFRRCIAEQPANAAAQWDLSLLLLRLGQYEEGWRQYEWRWRYHGFPSPRRTFPQPLWNDVPAPGETILIHAEQGLGDTLHFVRYLPLVRQKSGATRVLFECQPELARLLASHSDWNAEIFARQDWQGTGLPPFDRHLPLLSLPLALGLPEPLPAPTPYLQADPTLRAIWTERLTPSPGLRIGLNWAGNPHHKLDNRRSIDAGQFLPLLQIPGATFYNLHFGGRAIPAALLDAGLIDLSSHITDFADSAAFLDSLDLVISVDTATCHLAGALGKSVWTLLPFVPDWRWGATGDTTPWYATMRLFRQPLMGDWDPVLANIQAALEHLPKKVSS